MTRVTNTLRSLVGTRVQVSFTPRQGCFSPFPLGTILYRSSDMFSLGPWSALIQPEFHVLRPTQVAYTNSDHPFAYGAFTLYGRLSQYRSTKMVFCNCSKPLQRPPVCSYYPQCATLAGLHASGLGCSPFAHHYLGNLFDFFYIRLLRCFTSPTPPPIKTGLRPAPERLPHSDTLGSKVVCTSPRIFAAYRVLHRCQIPKASTVCPYLFTLLNIYCLLFNCQCTRGKISLVKTGGDDRIRTDDPWLAKPLLSH